MIKDISKKILMLILSLAMIAGSALTISPSVNASESQSISLNGTVADDVDGYLDSKALVVSTGMNNSVNYRLTPSWSTGSASKVQVFIKLPSLTYEDGKYSQTGPNEAPSPLGIRGKVNAGNGWIVVGDNTSDGGILQLEYVGRLNAGSNPAFDIELSTYNDGSDGVYGAIPEGVTLEMLGWVSYASFNDQSDTAWETEKKFDGESIVKLIVSNLEWSTSLTHSDLDDEGPVPIWDRYQYASYEYGIKNDSDNLSSLIEGFDVGFDINSNDIHINGIIPFDINRFKYVDNEVVENEDINDMSGLFIGVPDRGGILIYDITDWDRKSELDDPLPYRYTGSGSIMLEQSKGDSTREITPENAPGVSERKYLLKLPLSRQGFPDLPTNFKVIGITNVKFAQGSNWSKTIVNEREISAPTYNFEMNHKSKQDNVVYGYDTHFSVSNFKNTSNAPIFKPRLGYTIDSDFNLDYIRLKLPKDLVFEDYIQERFLTYENKELEDIIEIIPDEILEDDDYQYFDVKVNDLNDKFTLHLQDVLQKKESSPLLLEVYGKVYKVKQITNTATLTYVEKQASNDHLGQNTSYTEINHELIKEASINIVYPKEVVPSVSLRINGSERLNDEKIYEGTGIYDEAINLDYFLGTKDEVAQDVIFKAEINRDQMAIQDSSLILKKELFDQAEEILVYSVNDKEETRKIDYEFLGEDLLIKSDENILEYVIKMKTLKASNDHLIRVTGTLNKGVSRLHTVEANLETYQPLPYDQTLNAQTQGRISITLPQELNPQNVIDVYYGDLKTQNVAYESRFDVYFTVDTKNVVSPNASYTIDLLKAEKNGNFEIKDVIINEEFVKEVVYIDAKGREFSSFSEANRIKKIVITYEDFVADGAYEVAHLKVDAHIDMGSSQSIKATFKGDQKAPFLEEKVKEALTRVTVYDTKTTVSVKGVNQVDEQLGVSNKYSVDIYRHWNRGYTYNTKDYTLDQGYKSLGGFTASMVRPNATYANNDQRVTISNTLPDHFDLYYLKIREEAKDYITSVNIYRKVDGQEVLWHEVSGEDWVANTQEGNFWRINTALYENTKEDLFKTSKTSQGVYEHPYFKSAWHDDVSPQYPIVKVDVIFDFNRESENAKPEMAGSHSDLIEYMGRFYKTSLAKEVTVLQSGDKFGKNHDQERSAKAEINSLVGYSYAQSSTGAHDNTSLSQKQILMGTLGEYKASIYNKETFRVAYYGGHGPDVYTPVHTEHDEWLQMRNSGFFHDTLIYEFTYPDNPYQDAIYNYNAQYFIVEDTRVLKYLDKAIVHLNDQSTIEIDSINQDQVFKINYESKDETQLITNLDDYTLQLKKDVYPLKVELQFKEINGFGERTAEIDGNAEDDLNNLKTVDVRVGGIVNGDKALVGTTQLYRLQDDQKQKTLLHTSSASLKGITPKLNAQVSMTYDKTKIYDYQADGVSPNESTVFLAVENKGEADISEVSISFKPDQNFRAKTVSIPQEIFEGRWIVESVLFDNVEVQSYFEKEDDFYVLDIDKLFANNILKPTTYSQLETEYVNKMVKDMRIKFIGKDETVRMYGAFSKMELEDDTLLSRMMEGNNIIVSGIWVDQSDSNVWDWNSKPSFTTKDTKASDEQITAYTEFNVSAIATSYQTIYTSSGTGNQGEKPTLTHRSSINNAKSPRLYNRVAKMDVSAQHIDRDNKVIADSKVFFDEDTHKYVNYNNLAVSDTTRVLYRLSNQGVKAVDNDTSGNIPVFNPYFEITAPQGLIIKDASVLLEPLDFIDDEHFKASQIAHETKDKKRYTLELEQVLEWQDAVYVMVEFETINDFDEDLKATQNKTSNWKAYARPSLTHGFKSYNSSGRDGTLISGRRDILVDKMHVGELSNTSYRFSNPNQLKIKSRFNEENISNKEMTLTVSDIKNELHHSNTELMVTLQLDEFKKELKAVNENTYGGFELTEFPKPSTQEGYLEPQVFFKDNNEWVSVEDFDESYDLKDINELKINYGIVKDDFVAPSFDVLGIGHWKTKGQLNTKTYDISSTAQLDLIHAGSSQYAYQTRDASRVYKAIAKTELNLQAFDTKEEALEDYDGSKVGKYSYIPNESFYYKISVLNENNFQGLKTNTPYGKADFINPIVYDKIPEYLKAEDFEIKIFDKDGSERSFIAPEITHKDIVGLDVGGSQKFSNDRHNDGYGLLSSQHPTNTTVNPASLINFDLVTFDFKEENLARGERLEIVYKVTARQDNLPYAQYMDNTAVWAPLFGWYGNNNPVSSTIKNHSMDMASLLHDVGLSGNKGHELTSEEFLSNSESWTHGSTATRRKATNTSSTQSTYYDESANKEKTHKVVMNEEASNDLHISFNGGLDEVYNYLTRARVNDQKVVSEERILWTQKGLQLQRAWLYGASEFRGNRVRSAYGTDLANFYEHDGSLNHSDIQRHGYTPYDYDDYTYAVELHEIFSVRLHAVNLGDRSLESGIKYTEILPLGISPFDEDGNLLGVKAFSNNKILEDVHVKVIQTPDMDVGYRAPQQLQEARSYKEKYLEGIPYVVEIMVKNPLHAWFKGDDTLKYQFVDLTLRVEEEIAPSTHLGVHQDMSVWHDELRVSPIEYEEYLEIYSKEYGGFTRGLNSSFAQNKKYYKNDAVSEGFELDHAYLTSTSFTTYLSFEPYGLYIRGLNAKNTRLDDQTLVTGDQIAMRKPTLRVYTTPEKVNKKDARYGNIDDFDVNIYDEMILHATIENQQLEVRAEYNRQNEGYNYYSGDNYNDDIWKNAPQTIGGAKGSYFEPVVTLTLPKGIAPILKNNRTARYYDEASEYQNIDVKIEVNDITGLHQTSLNKDVTEFFDVNVEVIEGQFVLTFTVNKDKAADIKYNQSLVISPRVKVIDNVDQTIQIEASTKRSIFTPIVSKKYTTGSTPSQSDRDTNRKVLGRNNVLISENDRLRKDSTSNYSRNMGYLKVDERLILETQLKESGVIGETRLRQRQASLYNDTKVMKDLNDTPKEIAQVDPAGRHWYTTQLKNDVIKNNNPSIESLSAGDIHHSRFTFTYIVSDFAKVLENYRIRIDDQLYTPEELGYTVTFEKSEDFKTGQQKVIFIVTPKDGELLSQENFEFIWEVLLVDGYENESDKDELVWKAKDLILESYVSVVTDDLEVGTLKEEDFVIQDEKQFNYTIHKTDQELGYNANETDVVDYAFDQAEIEIIKPQLEVRKNTLKPRNLYTNGLTGDNYFKSIDDIEFLINHAEVVGSGVKEFVIEDILPTHVQSESSIQISRLPLQTEALYVSSGAWKFPDKTLSYVEEQGKKLEDYFRVFIHYSKEPAIDGYELENWHVLDSEGTSPLESKVYTFENVNPKKIRIILKAMLPDELLIPSETRLNVDANPETEVRERVIETDPDNLNIDIHPKEVVDHSIRIGVRALSDTSSTLFIYNTAQAWSNYVSDKYVKLDQSETRSYLTPSRPVVNINHSAQYFKYNHEDKSDHPYSWSNNTTINPITLPHLKFKAEVVNADESMWDEDERNAYEEDILIDPFVTIQVPKVMESMQEDLQYVSYETLDETHPLHDDYRNDSGLPINQANGLWTWYLIRNEKAVATSFVELIDTYTGPWTNADQNVLSFWFKGNIYPGDRLVVEYIGEVNAYTPGISNNLKSIAMVSNNTGILSPLNSRKNQHNVLGYELDDLDLNRNKKNNDRLVFNEKSLFTYEKYDNFGKRKSVSSDLNKIGTISPEATPIKEGGTYTYTITVDNSKDFSDNPYVYPIMYDVFPHEGDTEILNQNVNRDSQFEGELLLDSINVKISGKIDQEYVQGRDYTAYVGPFKKVNKEIVSVEFPEAISQEFFEGLNTPNEKSSLRDEYFVTVSDFKKLAVDREKEIKSLLIMFNDKDYKLVGDSQITATYDMKARINAPVWLQESIKGLSETYDLYTAWNTFVATQKVSRFLPQESNQAGTYITEQKDKTYIGSYVWNDYNYDGLKNEGELYQDSNGRELLEPIDGKDPGINGVKVSLRTPKGYPVDEFGYAIDFKDEQWLRVDENTGEIILDETFLKPIESTGPLETITEDDYHGNAGYYIFSNIEKRDYIVVYEFPEAYDYYSVTTDTLFKDHQLTTYNAQDSFDIVTDTIDHDRLVAVSDPVDLNRDVSDDLLMSFDIGVAHQIKVGGAIFKENNETLDGYRDSKEKGIANYHIYVKEMDGSQAVDINGKPIVTTSDEDGNYHFLLTPFSREYYFVVTDENDTYTKQTVVSPFIHNVNPFKEVSDNDAYTIKGEEEIRTNTLDFNIKDLYDSKFSDRLSVSVGVYDKKDTAVIGNRVWLDENKNGLQDSFEVGLENQELHLEQFYTVDGKRIKTTYAQTTKSNEDGYYYFKNVPTSITVGKDKLVAEYQVLIKEVLPGMNITLDYVGSDISIDNNFMLSGKMPEDEVIVVAEYTDGNYDFYEPVNDNTIDLGLHYNEYSRVSGVVFKDLDKTGLNTHHEEIEDDVLIELAVKYKGQWQPVYKENGVMISPSVSYKDTFEKVSTIGTHYDFDQLLIVDDQTNEILEYRIEINDIPIWYAISEYQVGEDSTIDSDFKESNRNKYIDVVSESFVLNPLHLENLIGIDTFNEGHIENVDLGLIVLPKTRIIGDRLWIDENEDGLQEEQEKAIEQKEVFLYEVIDKELVPVKENGKQISTLTDKNGAYEFEVDLAHFDSNEDSYNKLRQYVLVFNRDANHYPTKIVETSFALNSDFTPLKNSDYIHKIDDIYHSLVSRVAKIADLDENGYVDYQSTSDDLDIDGGLIEYAKEVTVGGYYWLDTNHDGIMIDEKGLENRAITLQKYNSLEDTWESLEEAVTNRDGYYEFKVSPTSYDRDDEEYLKPYRYRVVSARESFERWTLLKPESDLVVNRMETLDAKVGVSEEFNIFDEGDISSLKDDLTMGIGVIAYETEVVVGGIMWHDQNANGLIEKEEDLLENRAVTLQQLINEQWISIENTKTDEKGYYEFSVIPTNYDEDDENYLVANQYRVISNREGYEAWTIFKDDVDNTIQDSKKHEGITTNFKVFSDGEISSAKSDKTKHIGLLIYDHSVKIRGKYWEDANLDGMIDASEGNIENREVYLWKYDLELEDYVLMDDVKTDEDGWYEFTVEASNYDVDSDDYLVPYKYRISSTRNGYEIWSINKEDDSSDLDNKISEWQTGLGKIDEIKVMESHDISSVKDRMDLHIGIKKYPHTVLVGNRVTLEDTGRGISDVNLNLQVFDEAVNDWVSIPDLNGQKTAQTDKDGYYFFEVSPLNYDTHSENYLKEIKYRIVIEVPKGYKLKNLEYSEASSLLSGKEDSILDQIQDDLTLDFVLEKQGEENVKTAIDTSVPTLLFMVSFIGSGLLFILLRKRRDYEI